MLENKLDAIILLRGLGREQAHWMGIAEKISALYPDIRILPMDITGNGVFYQQASDTSVFKMREKLSERLNQEYPGVKSFALIAISMGGMIATEWAKAEPDKVKCLVLINSSFSGISPFYKRLKWQNYWKLIKATLGSVKVKEELIFSLTTNLINDVQTKKRVIDIWIEIAKYRPVSLINFIRQLIAAANYQLPLIKKPILVLACKQDRLVDYTSSLKLIKRCEQAEIKIHPTAGHDLPLDDPDWLIEQIKAFIKTSG